VTIAHKLTSGKKAQFFKTLKVQLEIDTLFVYAQTQREFGEHVLKIEPSKMKLIAFHADSDFFRPLEKLLRTPSQFCSAGLEWRDYPTLVETARQLSGCMFKIAAASPWSKHRNELSGAELPSNVSAKSYDYCELRALYSESVATIVPLYENDFQAGVTTILESMAMGRPVIATRTAGQKDVIVEGVTGFYVPPGNPAALSAIVSRLNRDPAECEKIGRQARAWLLENASLKKWASTIADDILKIPPPGACDRLSGL
jgi:glycosyltransferase involved in cell wall biosynthesis